MIKKYFNSITITIFIGLSLSISGYIIARGNENAKIVQDFDNDSITLANSFKTELYKNIDSLFTLKSFFISSTNVTREDFKTFVNYSLSNNKGIQALEWIPEIKKNDRDFYEKLAIDDGIKNFKIKSLSSSGELLESKINEIYYPVYFLEPYLGNQNVLGFDLFSNDSRKKSILKSLKTGLPVTSERITLVQESGNSYGFLIFIPVYKNLDFKGFVLGVFRVETILNVAIINNPNFNKDFHISILDPTVSEEKGLLTKDTYIGNSDLIHSTEIDLPSAKWTLKIMADDNYIRSRRSNIPFLIFISILLLTLSFVLLIIHIIRLKDEKISIENIVKDRTVNLREAKDLAEESNRLKSNFLSMISHELKTPLTVIIGNINFLTSEDKIKSLFAVKEDNEFKKVLLSKEFIPEITDIATYIYDSSKDLLKLINDILDISRLEAGDVKLTYSDFNISLVLDELTKSLKNKNEENKNKINIKVEGYNHIIADKVRIHQILYNLVSNSIKFTKEGLIEIVIDIKDDNIIFLISDTGEGMSSEVLNVIFDPFRQVESPLKRIHGGSGLGLAIAEKLVKLHGGIINIESKIKVGTKVVFTIPNRKQDEVEAIKNRSSYE